MHRRAFLVIICLVMAVGVFLTGYILNKAPLPQVDTVAANRIVKEVANEFADGRFGKTTSDLYDYTVLDRNGNILYSSGVSAPLSINSAVKNHDAILDVTDGDVLYGKVLISTQYNDQLLEQRKNVTALSFGMFGVMLLLVLLYDSYLDKKILKPFKGLRDFARHIAMGNLDVPLPMDRNHVFGAFTESFDIMREELSAARQREAYANRSKKELVASLSHDIKTPVTSIKLVSELLLVTEQRTPAADKISTIYEKAEQIDKLITDMLNATLKDLGELKVHTEEKSSALLEPMVRNSDYYGKVAMDPIPGCLLLFDPLRMGQVIDNIISNAYKYAGTEITIVSELMEEGLRMEFMDYGSGVPAEELAKLLQKFYRGSNSQSPGEHGSGLGLYIAHHLMVQMGGELQYYNRSDGFSVEIFIRFA